MKPDGGLIVAVIGLAYEYMMILKAVFKAKHIEPKTKTKTCIEMYKVSKNE